MRTEPLANDHYFLPVAVTLNLKNITCVCRNGSAQEHNVKAADCIATATARSTYVSVVNCVILALLPILAGRLRHA